MSIFVQEMGLFLLWGHDSCAYARHYNTTAKFIRRTVSMANCSWSSCLRMNILAVLENLIQFSSLYSLVQHMVELRQQKVGKAVEL